MREETERERGRNETVTRRGILGCYSTPPSSHRTHSKAWNLYFYHTRFAITFSSISSLSSSFLPVSSRFDAFTGVPASPISIPLKRNVVIRWNLILPGYSSDNREFSSNRTEYCERKHFYALLLLLLSQVGNYTVGIPVTCLIDVILSKSSK